jgi:hypothetical protein
MIYDQFKLASCLTCENEELKTNDSHCKICGIFILNYCGGKTDIHSNVISNPCNIILDGNARYCTKCGALSAYSKLGLLKNWQEETEERNNFFQENFQEEEIPF